MEIEYVAVSKLSPSAFNPPQRTDDGAISDLLEDIRKDGILVPLAVTKDGRIIDGHRRYACAVKLELSEVPVIRYEASTQEEVLQLWWEINRSRRALMSKEVLWFYAQGGKPDGDIAREISHLSADLGADGVRKLAEMRIVSPRIASEARHVARYCGMANDRAFREKIVWWLIAHKQRLAVRHVIALEGPAESIIKAVNEDRPIKVVYL